MLAIQLAHSKSLDQKTQINQVSRQKNNDEKQAVEFPGPILDRFRPSNLSAGNLISGFQNYVRMGHTPKRQFDVTSCLFGVSYILAANLLPEKHILELLALDKKDEMGYHRFPVGCFSSLHKVISIFNAP